MNTNTHTNDIQSTVISDILKRKLNCTVICEGGGCNFSLVTSIEDSVVV